METKEDMRRRLTRYEIMEMLMMQLIMELDDAVSFMDLFTEDEEARNRRERKAVLVELAADFFKEKIMQDSMQEKDGK